MCIRTIWMGLLALGAWGLPAAAQTTAPGDASAAAAFLQAKWQGAATCGRKASVTIEIDKTEVKDGAVILSGKSSGGDGKSLKIDGLVTGRYEPASGLLQLSGGPRFNEANDCAGVKVLGQCVRASGIFAPNPEKQRQERLEVMTNSSFTLVLGRDDAQQALVGTAHGAAFDCAGFTMARADRSAPTLLAAMSLETERAALGFLEGLRYGEPVPASYPLARVSWLERLSRRGDAVSTAELGRMYETGQPPYTRDLQMAAQYYLKAAQAGESRAQRRLSRLLAMGQGVPQNLAESERWSAAATATTAAVGRYCVTPPMIAAYRELLEALKNDPGMRMLMMFGGGITGLEFNEGSFRIEGAGVEGATTIDGPFLCRVVGRNVGASVRNVKPEFAYAGEDQQGRTWYYDQRGDVAMNDIIASLVNSASEQVQASAAFAVKPMGNQRFRVRVVQEQINTGNVYATEVQIGPDMLALVQRSATPPAQPAPVVQPAQPTAPVAAPPQRPAPRLAAARADDQGRERAIWSLCQTATTAALCQAYLQDYPSGTYAGAAQRRLAELARGAVSAAPAAPAAPATAAMAATAPWPDGSIERAVDAGFLRWGQAWAMDRYIGGSALVTERDCAADRCQARGMFKFRRLGAVLSIAFVADLVRQDAGSAVLSRLCYADPSSARQECANF